LQLYQLRFRSKPLLRRAEQLLYFFSGHIAEPVGSKKYTLCPAQALSMVEGDTCLGRCLPSLFLAERF
jgi:hypothetical protein